jgi:hypothetical protein
LIPCQLWKKQTPSGHSSNNKDEEKREKKQQKLSIKRIIKQNIGKRVYAFNFYDTFLEKGYILENPGSIPPSSIFNHTPPQIQYS